MSRLLYTICSAAIMLAVSSNGFADEALATNNNTMVAAKASNSCKPVPMAKPCKPAEKTNPCPCDCEPPPCCFFEQGLALEDDVKPPCDVKYHPGYNAAAAIKVACSWDFNIDASFIYWNASQDAMDVTYVPPFISAVSSSPGSVVNQSTGYKPGFKVGIGWDADFDNWALNAEYTWLHQSQSTTATTEIGFHINDWYPVTNDILSEPYPEVSSNWTMHMDMLDVIVSRPYYQGTHLTVSPMCGLRGLWLRQAMTIELANGPDIASASSLNNSHSWAIGPKCGVNSHWLVWRGLRFEGEVGASVLYTKYTSINNTETLVPIELSPIHTVTSTADSFSTVRPTLDMGLGLGYGMYMMQNRFFVDLAVRYDFSQFWAQNVMRNFASQLSGRDDLIGDLHMHGLTVTLRCDF